MAQYNNSTHTPDDWNHGLNSIPFSEGLFVILVFSYGLIIQLQKPIR